LAVHVSGVAAKAADGSQRVKVMPGGCLASRRKLSATGEEKRWRAWVRPHATKPPAAIVRREKAIDSEYLMLESPTSARTLADGLQKRAWRSGREAADPEW